MNTFDHIAPDDPPVLLAGVEWEHNPDPHGITQLRTTLKDGVRIVLDARGGSIWATVKTPTGRDGSEYSRVIEGHPDAESAARWALSYHLPA